MKQPPEKEKKSAPAADASKCCSALIPNSQQPAGTLPDKTTDKVFTVNLHVQTTSPCTIFTLLSQFSSF